MPMYLIIGMAILALVLVLIIKSNKNRKTGSPNKPTNYVPTSELIRRTEERIAASKTLLAEIKNNKVDETIIAGAELEVESENHEEYEVTGVHIPNRKNYILNYCAEYDQVDLKHEKNNKYSDRAIVVKHNRKTIGYIAEYDVEVIHEIIAKPYKAIITEIGYDGSFLTVRLTIGY